MVIDISEWTYAYGLIELSFEKTLTMNINSLSRSANRFMFHRPGPETISSGLGYSSVELVMCSFARVAAAGPLSAQGKPARDIMGLLPRDESSTDLLLLFRRLVYRGLASEDDRRGSVTINLKLI